MKVDLKTKSPESRDKSSRGNASQFFIAGELCRRGYSAVITLGNTPNVDILCSNQQGTCFAHIQVKTFVPGNRTCSVGLKAMKNVGPTFFWVLGGIPLAGSDKPFEYYIIPSEGHGPECCRSAQPLAIHSGSKGPSPQGQQGPHSSSSALQICQWLGYFILSRQVGLY
jgi:hypothetical protein